MQIRNKFKFEEPIGQYEKQENEKKDLEYRKRHPEIYGTIESVTKGIF